MLHKAIGRFLGQDLEGQKTVGWYIKSAQRKQTNKLPSNSSVLFGKADFQKWRDKDILKEKLGLIPAQGRGMPFLWLTLRNNEEICLSKLIKYVKFSLG